MGGRGAIAGAGGNNLKSKLPELTGSEKQIKWATDIRNNYIELQKAEENMLKHLKNNDEVSISDYYISQEQVREAKKEYSKNVKKVLSESNSNKWIQGLRGVNESNVKYTKDRINKWIKNKNTKEMNKYIADTNEALKRFLR